MAAIVGMAYHAENRISGRSISFFGHNEEVDSAADWEQRKLAQCNPN
nr:hypothetical protein [Comamonas koreensis]